MPNLTNPKFEAARICFEAACEASRKHSALAADALAKYGNHGAQISGCVRDHFPDAVKDELRHWAQTVTRRLEVAYQNRPARVRLATMVRLGREVATRDGSGFYGPQPLQS
jgi:hypothetical protein